MESINLFSFFAFFLCMVIGAYWHYRKVRSTGRHNGSLWDYLVADHPSRSGAVAVAILAASWTASTTGTADVIDVRLMWALLSNGEMHVPSINMIVMAIGLGYAFDSKLNKGGME